LRAGKEGTQANRGQAAGEKGVISYINGRNRDQKTRTDIQEGSAGGVRGLSCNANRRGKKDPRPIQDAK